MKKYVYLLAMAFFAIQILSCSKSDDENVLQQQDSVLSRSLSDDDATDIPGGTNTAPVEGPTFYEEYMPEVVMVSALGTFSTIDQDGKVEVQNNLGGSVQTKEGSSFTMTYKGKSLHIEGTGITHPLTWATYQTTLSLDIDDASLIKKGKAKITNFSLTTNTELTYGGETTTGRAHLAANDIPMVSDDIVYTYWKGGTVTDYSYYTDDLSLNLVDNPGNYLEVWISFKDGSSAKARIGG